MTVRDQSANRVILLIEDEPDVREAVADILRRESYEVVEVADAAAAKKVFASDLHLDFIITNRMLQGSPKGVQLVAEARIRRPELPAILITGSGPVPERGDLVVLFKPFKAKVLLAQVAEQLTRSRILAGARAQ